MAYPNHRGMELEREVEALSAEYDKQIRWLEKRIANLEKRLVNFNISRAVSWRNQGDI